MAVAAKMNLCLLLLVIIGWSAATREFRRTRPREPVATDTCHTAPHWTAFAVESDGVHEQKINPMLENYGKVVLVALTSASSKHSLDQAQKLGTLEQYFHGNSMSDVQFILVNAAKSRNNINHLLVQNLTLTIVQEDEDDPVWSKLGGKKDHVYIYDRCGRLTYAIPFPLSIIHPRQQLVESSVVSTYLDDLCDDRKCGRDEKTVSTEDSADTELLNTTHSVLVDVTEISNTTETVLPEETDERDLPDDQDNSDEREKVHLPEQTENANKGLAKAEEKIKETTQPPSFVSYLRTLYNKALSYFPWSSSNKEKDDRQLNYVQRFNKEQETQVENATRIESEEDLCNITRKNSCKSWPKKKLDHARICCNLHSCNRSAQYLQKHCKHYPEHRCKKVDLVLRCCPDIEAPNERGSASSDPKS